MNSSFTGLSIGLSVAIVLIFSFVGHQLPELARPVYYHHRFARRSRRSHLGALPLPDHPERARLDGRDHEPGRGDVELRAGRYLRPQESARGNGSPRRRLGSRRQPLAPGLDDRPGHDHWHVADGPGFGRGRGTKTRPSVAPLSVAWSSPLWPHYSSCPSSSVICTGARCGCRSVSAARNPNSLTLSA